MPVVPAGGKSAAPDRQRHRAATESRHRKPLALIADVLHNVVMQSGRWFQSLPADVRKEIAQHARMRRFREGSAIFREGDANTGLHWLRDGRVRISGFAHDGTEALMAMLQPGDWTGFLANLDGGPYALSAFCETDCDVATLSPQSVSDIFEISVARYKLLAKAELRVARRNYYYLVEQEGGPPLQRLAYRLLDLADGPHGQPEDAPLAAIRISQEQLGAATRLSRQKVNACLQQLAGQGLVFVSRGSVSIIDANALSLIALREQ